MIGRTISHYRIVSQLGAGGMGIVYRAEDVRLGRPVALKFVSDDLGADEQAIQRLRSEARAASALNHGNICTIYDVGEDEGRPFIVMELMKGENLRDRLGKGRLKVHHLVDMGIEIADALHATHRDGIIHRDIKPGNIFLTESGHVKLLDFGLAKLTPHFTGSSQTGATRESTVAGVTLGTISYMSPEQATGEELDGRTDLFSLGVVLYECATGVHPFPGKTSAVTLAAILHKAPIAPIALNPELPLRLQEVVNNCLEKDRELRYQSAADLRADLKRVRRDLESGDTRTVDVIAARGLSGVEKEKTSPTGSPVAPLPSEGTSNTLVGAVALGVIALLAVGAYAILRDRPVPPPVSETAATVPDAGVQGRLASATASLQARNYRAAAAFAGEVLAIDAGNRDAAKIRDEAQAMLSRFDAMIAETRQRLSGGDVVGAARALETARTIDPTAPVIVELSSELNDALRKADAAARAAAARAVREAAQADVRRQPAPPPSAPTIATQSTPSPPVPNPPPVVTPPPAAVAPAPTPEPIVPVQRPAPVVPEQRPAATPPDRTAPETAEPRAPSVSSEQDDAAIRRLAATYARAIEAKDLALFRSIKPNLSRAEERRLQDGFRAVTSQRVNLTVVSIDRNGDEATVVVRRRDTIDAGGRQQTAESQQTLRVARERGAWVIVDIR